MSAGPMAAKMVKERSSDKEQDAMDLDPAKRGR